MKNLFIGLLLLGSITVQANEKYTLGVCNIFENNDGERTVTVGGLLKNNISSDFGSTSHLGALYNSKLREGNCAKVVTLDREFLFKVTTVLSATSDLKLRSFCNFQANDLIVKEEMKATDTNGFFFKKYKPSEHSYSIAGKKETLYTVWFFTHIENMDWGNNSELQIECEKYKNIK
jgi:hypothetical protein